MSLPDRLVTAAAAVVALSYGLAGLAAPETVARLCAEDQLVENLGAALFLAAAILFGAATLIVHQRNRRADRRVGVFPGVLLAGGMLWIALEEISYGQRVLGFATPEVLLRLNTQKEFNLHNLRFWSSEQGLSHWFNVQRLFSMFWLVYCTIFPVLRRVARWPERLCRAVYLPVAPVPLGMLFLFNYVAAKGAVVWLPALVAALTELKESNYALLFTCFGAIEILCQRRSAAAPFEVPY